MFWIGLIVGFFCGALALHIYRCKNSGVECADCKAYYTGLLRDKDAVIHGLKSTKGKLGQELQAMAFRNSGYNAR
jgi:hypothetical protein